MSSAHDHVIMVGERNLTHERARLQGKLNHPSSGTSANWGRRLELQTQVDQLELEIEQATQGQSMPDTPSGRLFFAQPSD